MSTLLETLASELEKPRELSPRVLNYISGNYEIDQAATGSFLVNELPKLEDYEIDLILSPVFTPKLADQAVFAELLGDDAIPQKQWPALINQLADRPTRAQLVTADRMSHIVPLRPVTLERYVHRLRLDGTITGAPLQKINETCPPADRPLLKAIARRSIWESGSRGEILNRYLTNAPARNLYRLADAIELLDMVESHKPADIAGLLERIPARQEILRGQINTGSGSKPFFSPRIQEMHGGERDHRNNDESGVSIKEAELAFLERLQRVFV